MKSKYKAIKVAGKKMDEHRYIMEQLLGRKLTFNEVVHHKDGDKLNNSISNLEVLTRMEHSRIHMLGRVMTPDAKSKMREAYRKGKHGCKLSIDQVREIREYLLTSIGVSELARQFGVSRDTIHDIKTRNTWSWV